MYTERLFCRTTLVRLPVEYFVYFFFRFQTHFTTPTFKKAVCVSHNTNRVNFSAQLSVGFSFSNYNRYSRS